MPLTDHVALVSLTRDVSNRDLMRVAAALQKQVTRDLSPIWGIPATVNAFADLSSVPSDYYPVVVFNEAADLADRLAVTIGEEAATQLVDQFALAQVQGIHLNGFTRQPFALVEVSDLWSVTVSHETCEMLVDPYGNRLVAAAHPWNPEVRVNYLIEVCDPCLSIWYPVNGLPVSDFYTPRFFDPVRTEGVRYSFTGEVEYPLQILEDGYVSWIDPRDSGLYQLQSGEREPELLADVAALERSNLPLRILVDADPRTPRVAPQFLRPARSAAASTGVYGGVYEAAEGTALRTAEAVASLATGRG